MKHGSLFSLATLHKIFKHVFGFRVVQTGLFEVDPSVTVVAGSSGTIINATGHGAIVNDRINFTSGAYQYNEFGIVEIIDANSFRVDYTFPEGQEPANGDTFKLMRAVTASYDSSGSLSVTAAASPLLFTRNGADQEVTEDTATPANDRPLPVSDMGKSAFSPQVVDTSTLTGAFVTLLTFAQNCKQLSFQNNSGVVIDVSRNGTHVMVINAGEGKSLPFRSSSGETFQLRFNATSAAGAGNITFNFFN